MVRKLLLFMLVAAVLMVPRTATADITGFIGVTRTPENRALRGFAFGFGLLVVGFEFEYANTIEDKLESLPSLQTGSGNVLIQSPVEIFRIQPYGTVGGGLFRERLGTEQETNYGTNAGGGAKIALAGPLRLRLDYRVFRLNGKPINQTYQRFYAGANLSF